MFGVVEDGEGVRIVVAALAESTDLLDLAETVDSVAGDGTPVTVDLAAPHQTLLAMATMARCRQRAERRGGTVTVKPEPRGEAARMWRLGLRAFLGLPPGSLGD